MPMRSFKLMDFLINRQKKIVFMPWRWCTLTEDVWATGWKSGGYRRGLFGWRGSEGQGDRDLSEINIGALSERWNELV